MPELFRCQVGGAASPALLDSAHEALEAAWRAVPDVPDDLRQRMDLAVAEAVGNVVEHAGPEAFAELDVVVTGATVDAVLHADGPPVDVERDMPRSSAEGGRGLAILAAVLDEFDYRRADGRNEFVLGLRRT